MTFAPQREINATSGVRKSLLERGFDFGFESWSAARPGGLLSNLPVGAQSILGTILDGRSNAPRAQVPAVVIGEIPRTISPQDSGRGTVSKEGNLPTDDGELEELLEERRALEEFIRNSPIGTGTLPPIDEEKWSDIIRTPVPVPVVDDSEFEEEGEEMAHSWLHVGSQILGVLTQPEQQQVYNPPSAFAPSGGFVSGGSTMTYANSTGVRCKRRRRQRNILTQSNLNMLFQIATLPNNGNVRVALSRAIK